MYGKISNEIVVRIKISFKEKYIKYLEFLFIYYIDDPIHSLHSKIMKIHKKPPAILYVPISI